MSRPKIKLISRLKKLARRGNRGYPVGTVAYYGPDEAFASKVAVGIVLEEDGPCEAMERWFSDDLDIRRDMAVEKQIVAFLRSNGVRTVVMPDAILGCPHEEGIDYPDGEVCPRCPYWANRTRWIEKAKDLLE